MDDDLFQRDFNPRKPQKDNLFGWTIVILLLIGVAMACWLGSYAIFGHPENPKSYEILRKLKKIDPPKRFELTAAPPGEFLTPQKVYDRYAGLSDLEMRRENAELLREYLTNYHAISRLVPYLTGKFSILDSHILQNDDLFQNGVAALAQATDFPQVIVENVYPADAAAEPELKKMLTKGLEIKLQKTLDLSAIVHVEKLDNGRMQVTVVPLTYGAYTLREGNGTFSLTPPTDLHLASGFPIIRGEELQKALQAAVSPQGTPAIALDLNGNSGQPQSTATPAAPSLVRVATPEPVATPVPIAQATPTPVPLPIAQATPTPAPQATPVATPPVLALNTHPSPTPELPRETPAPTPPIAVATPVPTTASGVPLKPFLTAVSTPPVGTTAHGSWRTFAPGQMPRGRLVDARDAGSLADHGLNGQRLYLRGDFTVTASGESRAVLRSHGGGLVPFNGGAGGNTRIIVEYPAGSSPPSEGSEVQRNDLRPFQITDVRRGADGQVNVYVREITTP